MNKEKIVSVAVKIDDNVIAVVEPPGRHEDILVPLYKFGVDITGEQGFMTSKGRFVDRGEADRIAIAAGQTKKHNEYCLVSEDLW